MRNLLHPYHECISRGHGPYPPRIILGHASTMSDPSVRPCIKDPGPIRSRRIGSGLLPGHTPRRRPQDLTCGSTNTVGVRPISAQPRSSDEKSRSIMIQSHSTRLHISYACPFIFTSYMRLRFCGRGVCDLT